MIGWWTEDGTDGNLELLSFDFDEAKSVIGWWVYWEDDDKMIFFNLNSIGPREQLSLNPA